MRTLLRLLMLLNAAVFFFGAMLRAGVIVGPFRQPRNIPATIAEIAFGLALVRGAAASARSAPFLGNLAAVGGIVPGVASQLPSGGRLTPAPDHRIMLLLIGACIVISGLDRPGKARGA